jgi:hypothetical protein
LEKKLTIICQKQNSRTNIGSIQIEAHLIVIAYKLLLFETTSPKLPNLLKIISHLLLTVLTNFSRNITLNVLSRATVGYLLFFALEQLGGSLQRRKIRIYDS